MSRRSFAAAWVIGACLLVPVSLNAATVAVTSQRIASAAHSFLATLDESQRRAVLFPLDDASQRVRWSNLPIAMAPRGGISLQEMNAAQRGAAMNLLAATLSRNGFEKVQQIMQADEVLKKGSDPGRATLFGKDLFYISFLGTPSASEPWMLQFGGHHLALNITIAGEQGVLTPTLTGAQPAIYKLDGRTVRPLEGESDKALALLNALDARQKSQAILGYRVADLVLGPGQDGKTIQPEGLKATGMNAQQRRLLLSVIAQWVDIIHESAATTRMKEIEATLADTWFAWSGPTTIEPGSNVTAYYRIQGPSVIIEYAPQGRDPASHIHTMYRDPTNDYGRKLISR